MDDWYTNQIWPFLPKRITARCYIWWDIFFPRIEHSWHHSQIFFCCRFLHPPVCSFICGERKQPLVRASELETVVAVYLQNRSHKPLCNIYETALITDCFNCLPFLSAPLVWKLDATQWHRRDVWRRMKAIITGHDAISKAVIMDCLIHNGFIALENMLC